MFQNNKSLNKFNYKNFLEFFFYFIVFITPLITTYNDQQNINRILALQIIFIFLLLFQKNFLNLIINSVKNNQKTVIILSLFLISITISYVGSPGKIEDWGFEFVRHKYLQSVIYFLFFITTYIYLNKYQLNFKYFKKAITLSALLFVLITYTRYFFEVNSEIYNLLSFFSTIRSPGYVLTSLISLFIGFILIKNSKNLNFTDIAILSTLISLVYFFGGRGNLISIIIACIISIVYQRIIKENINILISTYLTSFVLGLIILEIFKFLYSLNSDITVPSHILLRSNFLDRIEIWVACLNLLKENVFFGQGPNILILLQANGLLEIGNWSKNNMMVSHPHNFLIQFLIEWGIVGTLLILFLMTKNMLKGIIILIKKQNKYLIIPVLNVAGLTAHGLVDGTYIHPVTVTFLLISNAMIAANVKFK